MRPLTARRTAVAATVLLGLGFSLAATGCDTPPQVVEIAPGRSAGQVPSDAPVRIRFDRAVDRDSVATHFSTSPQVKGTVRWASPSEMVFEHVPFQPDTGYRVDLRAGYRDTAGHVNSLLHGWSFTTESAPRVVASAPAAGEADVDPAGYLSLRFTREMDLTSLQRSLSISPAASFSLRFDPSDPAAVLVAPGALLSPDTDYLLAVPATAEDTHGNLLGAGVVVPFRTGAARALRHSVTFIPQFDGGQAAGVWSVDQSRVPRRLVAEGSTAFAWSPDGLRLLVRSAAGAWVDAGLGGDRVSLPFRAERAAYLARGYAYLAGTVLTVHPASGPDVPISASATDFTVSPDGLRIAFATTSGDIQGYAVDLGTRYRIQPEAGTITGLTFASDGRRLAYRLDSFTGSPTAIRVRDLAGGSAAFSIATGAVGDPRWLPDAGHVLVSATVTNPGGAPITRAFRLSTAAASDQALRPESAIPMSTPLDVLDPRPSPDGHQVAFRAAAAGRSELWLMNADGTGLAPLTSYDSLSFPYSVVEPAWTRA